VNRPIQDATCQGWRSRQKSKSKNCPPRRPPRPPILSRPPFEWNVALICIVILAEDDVPASCERLPWIPTIKERNVFHITSQVSALVQSADVLGVILICLLYQIPTTIDGIPTAAETSCPTFNCFNSCCVLWFLRMARCPHTPSSFIGALLFRRRLPTRDCTILRSVKCTRDS
jgi:hypothetical protein